MRCVDCESEGCCCCCCEPVRAVGYGRARWSYIGGEVREEDEGAGAAAVAQCPLLRLDCAEDEEEEARGGEKGKSCKVGPVKKGPVGLCDDETGERAHSPIEGTAKPLGTSCRPLWVTSREYAWSCASGGRSVLVGGDADCWWWWWWCWAWCVWWWWYCCGGGCG